MIYILFAAENPVEQRLMGVQHFKETIASEVLQGSTSAKAVSSAKSGDRKGKVDENWGKLLWDSLVVH